MDKANRQREQQYKIQIMCIFLFKLVYTFDYSYKC